MILRFAFFRDWIEGGIPIAYWISSFYFPQAENPQKLVGTDSLAYCKCIWWMWTDVNGIAKLANFILHRHTCRSNVPRSDHKSLQQCTNRCLQPALAFTSGVVLTCTLPLCRTSLGRCNEYLEVSWNRGTPSCHPFIDGIFPNKNHPAMGIPHDYGNPLQRHAGLPDLSATRLLPKEPDSGGSVMCLGTLVATPPQVHRISRVLRSYKGVGEWDAWSYGQWLFVVPKRYPVLTTFSKDWSKFYSASTITESKSNRAKWIQMMPREGMVQTICSSHVCLRLSFEFVMQDGAEIMLWTWSVNLWISLHWSWVQDTADPQALQGAPEEGIYIHGLFMDTWQWLRCQNRFIMFYLWHPFSDEVYRWGSCMFLLFFLHMFGETRILMVHDGPWSNQGLDMVGNRLYNKETWHAVSGCRQHVDQPWIRTSTEKYTLPIFMVKLAYKWYISSWYPRYIIYSW